MSQEAGGAGYEDGVVIHMLQMNNETMKNEQWAMTNDKWTMKHRSCFM
jgi:hypothetical protein